MEKKKILIISAHPEPASFCMSLKNEAVRHFTTIGYEVKESDLYAMKFNPVGDKSDFKSIGNEEFFKYQAEQTNAFKNGLFKDDLQTEMDKLVWCDYLVFAFPLWWFGLPAILKGWVDRVFAMGFAYGGGRGVYDTGVFNDKTAFAILTTGGPDKSYKADGSNGDINTILFPIHHGMFYFCGMTVLPPFITYGPARKTKDELELELSRLNMYLELIENAVPIYKADLP